MKKFIVEMLILSPYFYAGSIFGKEMSDRHLSDNEHIKKYKHLIGYVFFMAGLIVVFMIIGYSTGGSNE